MSIFSKVDKAAFSSFEKVVGESGDETTRNLYLIFRVAVISAATVLLINIVLRFDFLGTSSWKLGEFGDFFGGVLNPILTFLMFIGLIITIVVQKSELSLARVEFAKTASALKEQSDSVKKQALENTFFNLLKLHSETLSSLCFNEDVLCCSLTVVPGERTSGRAVFSSILTWIHIEEFPQKSLENYTNFQNSENHIVGHYFRGLYQILKFIDDSGLSDHEKETYSRLFRAQLSADELALLYFNCICSSVDNGQFRTLLIKFKMLEHLRLGKEDFWDNFSISGRSVYTNKSDLLKYVVFNADGNILQSAFGNNSAAIRELYKNQKSTRNPPQYPL